MDRVVTLTHRADQAAADLAYWLSRPMAERIAAVEVLRRQAFGARATPSPERQRAGGR